MLKTLKFTIYILTVLMIILSIISCKEDKTLPVTKTLPVQKPVVEKNPVVEKKYKLKLGDLYLYSTNTVSAYWEFTNNSSDYIDQITMEADYDCCAYSVFGIKFINIGPGKTVKKEDLMKGTGRVKMSEIKSVNLKILRFMVNGKHDDEAKNKIEILPNRYDRKITFK